MQSDKRVGEINFFDFTNRQCKSTAAVWPPRSHVPASLLQPVTSTPGRVGGFQEQRDKRSGPLFELVFTFLSWFLVSFLFSILLFETLCLSLKHVLAANKHNEIELHRGPQK